MPSAQIFIFGKNVDKGCEKIAHILQNKALFVAKKAKKQ